jgi:pantetheine-phosphate adenylyltransferase
MKIITPGSYDPITLGHLDIIRRAAEKYEEVYAVIFINPEKKYRFSTEDRLEMLKLATSDIPNVICDSYDGYVVDYMKKHDIEKIVKGYRNSKDLEYEKVQAEYNFLHGGYETELLLSDEKYEKISSSEVRSRLSEKEDFEELVPSKVFEYIKGLCF